MPCLTRQDAWTKKIPCFGIGWKGKRLMPSFLCFGCSNKQIFCFRKEKKMFSQVDQVQHSFPSQIPLAFEERSEFQNQRTVAAKKCQNEKFPFPSGHFLSTFPVRLVCSLHHHREGKNTQFHEFYLIWRLCDGLKF